MSRKAEVCILTTEGTNCEQETAFAFQQAEADPTIVHINQLRDGSRNLANYGALVIPGGFSYGDAIGSGRVLANELVTRLSDQLQGFTGSQKPILGICNGFQVLVKAGLLPNRCVGQQTTTLTHNESGRFECRWVNLALASSAYKFMRPQDLDETTPASAIPMQVAHQEGRFFAEEPMLTQLKDNGQIVFQYAPGNNPNGSIADIAGICDETGTILGMMPHPERSITSFHPDRQRTEEACRVARMLFKNIVHYVRMS